MSNLPLFVVPVQMCIDLQRSLRTSDPALAVTMNDNLTRMVLQLPTLFLAGMAFGPASVLSKFKLHLFELLGEGPSTLHGTCIRAPGALALTAVLALVPSACRETLGSRTAAGAGCWRG